METIFLTGFMGAGKSTIARELGRRLSMTVFDTDELVEQFCQKSIPAIFTEEGEAAFRRHESSILRSVAKAGVIVSTGGGIVLDETNRRFMREHGIVIYLHVDPNMAIRRLKNDRSRPLLKNRETAHVFRLMAGRLPFYLEADYIVDTTMKSVDTVVDEMIGFLVRHERFWA